MGSDRARITYDEAQQYRSVIAQQGRVTLEADWNEAQQIIRTAIDQNACDVVGPTGTPDDGYRIILAGEDGSDAQPYDFAIQKGTMYVGGMRVVQTDPCLYSQQAESNWLDHDTSDQNHLNRWVDPKNLAKDSNHPTQEFIYLYLREQEVSAVEDPALLEPAIGGPDTTQRVRLIQRVVRKATDNPDCQSAFTTAQTDWETKHGLTFDAHTMRLASMGRLQVTYSPSTAQTSLCEPTADASYLEAENQLIRVQISAVDLTQKKYKLVWGFDNASFLYSVKCKDGHQTLELQSPPADDKHQPRAQQAVEVLQAAAKLSNGHYVAATTGQVFTLTEPYAPDLKTIKLPSPLCDPYQSSSPLFLRVWEEEKAFTPDQPVELGKTGIQVTLSTTCSNSGETPFHVGDYWQIAIRPGLSTPIYPERYTQKLQPPDGPRLWICPLAVVEWETGNNNDLNHSLVEDCRQKFDNLVELTNRPTLTDITIIKVQRLSAIALGIALGLVSALFTFLTCLVCREKFYQPFFCLSQEIPPTVTQSVNYLLIQAPAESTVPRWINLLQNCLLRAFVAFIIGSLIGFLVAVIYNWWVKTWGQPQQA